MCHALLLPLLTAMLGDQYPLLLPLLPPPLLLLLLLRETHCLLLRPHYGTLSPPSGARRASALLPKLTFPTPAPQLCEELCEVGVVQNAWKGLKNKR